MLVDVNLRYAVFHSVEAAGGASSSRGKTYTPIWAAMEMGFTGMEPSSVPVKFALRIARDSWDTSF